jgi:hypothetical protein
VVDEKVLDDEAYSEIEEEIMKEEIMEDFVVIEEWDEMISDSDSVGEVEGVSFDEVQMAALEGVIIVTLCEEE